MTNLSIFALLSVLALSVSAQAADDIAEKGPHASRPFARTVGSPYVSLKPAPSLPDVGLQVDAETDETSELIVTLNQQNHARLQALLSQWKVSGAAPAAIEDAFIKAVAARDRNVSLAYGGPVHARRLVGEERMSDADRARGDSLK